MIFPKFVLKLPIFSSKKNKKKKPIYSGEDFKFVSEMQSIIGYEIKNIHLFHEAFSLKSTYKRNYQKTYERLEFLGDSVLSTIISSYLFLNYPKANEGQMTQLKSKIVNRKTLNQIGDKFQLTKFLPKDKCSTSWGNNISGNLIEALIGAIFLDTDFENCRKVVLERIFSNEEINNLVNQVASYKSLLLEWSQKDKKLLEYQTFQEGEGKNITFRAIVVIEGQQVSSAMALSKKKAEEQAAEIAYHVLNDIKKN